MLRQGTPSVGYHLRSGVSDLQLQVEHTCRHEYIPTGFSQLKASPGEANLPVANGVHWDNELSPTITRQWESSSFSSNKKQKREQDGKGHGMSRTQQDKGGLKKCGKPGCPREQTATT